MSVKYSHDQKLTILRRQKEAVRCNMPVEEFCRQMGISKSTLVRWRRAAREAAKDDKVAS